MFSQGSQPTPLYVPVSQHPSNEYKVYTRVIQGSTNNHMGGPDYCDQNFFTLPQFGFIFSATF